MTPKKILIVEDQAEIRDLITILLELQDYKVIVASDGKEGLERASTEHPDLIITDIRMPRMNGIEMVKRLRGQPRFAGTPILSMTAYTEDVRAMREAGANEVVVKPTTPEEITAIIKRLLGLNGVYSFA